MDQTDLTARLDALTERVERLEVLEPTIQPPTVQGPPAWQLEPLALTIVDQDDTVAYGGAGRVDVGPIAWQMVRTWSEVIDAAADDAVSEVLGALANPVRLRIAVALARREMTTAALAEVLGQPSTGQLFHHLKDLLAAGIVHQPHRGVYALRHTRVIPLLTVICSAIDLVGRPSSDEPG